MSIPNPNPNIADGLSTDNLTWSSNKIASEIKEVSDQIEDISDVTTITPVPVSDLSSASVINAYKINNVLYINGRIASTTGISAGSEIFSIPGLNTYSENDFIDINGVSSTGSGTYAYTENTEIGIKVSIGTAAIASDNLFFFNASIVIKDI